MTTSERRPVPSFTRVRRVHLAVTTQPWPFAVMHAEAIRRHWQRRSADNPSFYDGEVFVLRHLRIDPGIGAAGTVSLERFSSFLFWRDGMARDSGTLDGFASAIVRSAEGHVLLGRAAGDTLNAGRVFLPGGFIDARDRQPDGGIDLEASIARELAEETGLAAARLCRTAGVIVARHGRHCCFAIEYRSPLDSEGLVQHVRSGMHRVATPDELTAVLTVGSELDLERHDVVDHARFVVSAVLAGH